LKSVFLIAIVAVALIGVMVPSVFAQNNDDVILTLTPNQKEYFFSEPIHITVNIDKIIPFTTPRCAVLNENGVDMTRFMTHNGGEFYFDSNNKKTGTLRVFLGEKWSGLVNTDDAIQLLNDNAKEVAGKYTVHCYLGSPSSNVGEGQTSFIIKNSISPILEFMIKNYTVDKYDVGVDGISDVEYTTAWSCASMCLTINVQNQQYYKIHAITSDLHEDFAIKITDHVDISQSYYRDYAKQVYNECYVGDPSWNRLTDSINCHVFDVTVQKIKDNTLGHLINDSEMEISAITTIPNTELKLKNDLSKVNQECGKGTVLKNNVCVLEISCGEGTIEQNGQCVVDNSSSGGGCLIATATYGSELAPQVQQLRELRDNQLLQTESGTAFMSTFNNVYYSFSPIIADYERENPLFKEAVKLAITPMISTLSLMENAESESEVLSIGISVIALNLGIYLAVPAIIVIGIRKRF
jgi:hypothetical protein